MGIPYPFNRVPFLGLSLVFMSGPTLGSVIARFVVRENPNPNNKHVTQLRTPITVASIDIPLVLVMDKSNTREASRVTSRGCKGTSTEMEKAPLSVT
jgi:hypothetical protein